MNIVASASVANSALFAQLIGIVITGIAALVILVTRILIQVSIMKSNMVSLEKDMIEASSDKDVVRWRDLKGTWILRRRHGG